MKYISGLLLLAYLSYQTKAATMTSVALCSHAKAENKCLVDACTAKFKQCSKENIPKQDDCKDLAALPDIEKDAELPTEYLEAMAKCYKAVECDDPNAKALLEGLSTCADEEIYGCVLKKAILLLIAIVVLLI